jgi:hypothetical protein
MVRGYAYKKYSAAGMVLLEDPARRHLYIEAHTSCIGPVYRTICEYLSTQQHLVEKLKADLLNKLFRGDVAD